MQHGVPGKASKHLIARARRQLGGRTGHARSRKEREALNLSSQSLADSRCNLHATSRSSHSRPSLSCRFIKFFSEGGRKFFFLGGANRPRTTRLIVKPHGRHDAVLLHDAARAGPPRRVLPHRDSGPGHQDNLCRVGAQGTRQPHSSHAACCRPQRCFPPRLTVTAAPSPPKDSSGKLPVLLFQSGYGHSSDGHAPFLERIAAEGCRGRARSTLHCGASDLVSSPRLPGDRARPVGRPAVRCTRHSRFPPPDLFLEVRPHSAPVCWSSSNCRD